MQNDGDFVNVILLYRDFALFHSVWTNAGFNVTFYPLGSGRFHPGLKVTGA
jgi:hypothetical protein